MENDQLQLAYNFVAYTDKNIFLTGKAGTGKTTFLHSLKDRLPKRMVVVAPTGVAAINAGGVTIHSFFQLPFGPIIPENITKSQTGRDLKPQGEKNPFQRFNRKKLNIIRSLDLLVIDEISMVRADLLDGIDSALRWVRRNNLPFGGVQLLMIGDLQQLAPVVKDNEWDLLRPYYSKPFFFSSKALERSEYVGIELQHIYRQQDERFISILNRIRTNEPDQQTLDELNQRYQPDFKPSDEEGYIILTTHNFAANNINEQRLNALEGETYTFEAVIHGEFPEYLYPNDASLDLKVGAQVMFIKNDSGAEKRFYNGKIGIISGIEDDTIFVECTNPLEIIAVNPLTWNNTKYDIDEKTKEITENVIGSYTQYPLKTAWAITIHKSQGLTFEKAIIDASSSFAHGQVYVALSRCKTLEGMVLSSKINYSSIKNDHSVYAFNESIERNKPNQEQLNAARSEYERRILNELFYFPEIQKSLTQLHRTIKETQSSFVSDTFQVVDTMLKITETEIISVADKFKNQLNYLHIQNPDFEANENLQDRVTKAADYFHKKLNENILIPFLELDLNCDNKLLQGLIQEYSQVFVANIQVKLACLAIGNKQFTVQQYLSVKAKEMLTPVKLSTKQKLQKKVESIQKENPNAELFNELRAWRNMIANEMDIPAFSVLHQKTLEDISIQLPITIADLRKIAGIGKVKAKTYGENILEIVKEYIYTNNIHKEVEETIEPEPKKKPKESSSSLQQTFELFKQGKTPVEIAHERTMAVSTIEGHLAQLITKGTLEIREVLPEDKIKTIALCIIENKTDNATLTLYKKLLQDDITYNEIRMVLNHLKTNDLI